MFKKLDILRADNITSKKIKILITDAGYKHTLSAVRSLGKAGYFVIAMASNKNALSFFSRYSNERLICPDPRNEEEFINYLISYLKKNKVDVLIPVGYVTTVTVSKYKEELLPYVKIPVTDYESMEIACNKEKTLHLANSLNIPCPKEYSSISDIEKFPIVIKGIYESGQIKYVNSFDDLQHFDLNNYILQEYIPGEGYGFYALFNKGVVCAFFMHKRVREYPITGGSSTCAVSIYDDNLKNAGLELMQSLQWHGVAMVEFKKDNRDGKFKLMEINPKFWGSLDLSIASGINFPVLLVLMSLNRNIESIFHYETGIKFRWPFPDDTLHLVANPKSIFEIVGECFDKKTRSNLWLADFLPNYFQIFDTCMILITRILCGNLRYPHGKPKVKK